MMDINKKKSIIFSILALVFLIINIIFIIMLKTVDVKHIGQKLTDVGFAEFNNNVLKSTGYEVNKGLDVASTIIMALAIALLVFVIIMAVIELIKVKSLKKIDKRYYAIAISCVLLIIIYVLFLIIKINYRPPLNNVRFESSYPSSHTLCTIGIFGILIPVVDKICKDNRLKYLIIGVFGILSILIIIFRMFCGKHWATDVIGGALFAFLVIFINYSMIYFIKYKFD